jgi:cobalamin biosynthesis Mg chelatase CobN
MYPRTNPHRIRLIRQHAVAGCVALLCLMLAEPAFAQRDCQAPPGRSGLDQYCETVPGATGDRSPGAGGGSGRDVSPSTRKRLERSGATGQALLGLVSGASVREEGSAADGDGGGRSSREESAADGDRGGKSSGASSGSGNEKAADEPSNDALSAVRSATDSGASAGPAFIWVLVAVAVALAGIAWIRYRLRGRTE